MVKLFGKKVVTIDNSSPDDNWIVNKCDVPVSVCCREIFGAFTLDLQPGSQQRIVPDAQAKVLPYGQYSYENFDYEIGKNQVWEVRKTGGKLTMAKVKG